jgi:hypothetical protein
MKLTKTLVFLMAIFITGCNISPLSPSNRPRINNNGGEIGDIKNNQNGIMSDLLTIKQRLDVVSRDIENLQNGFINSNNKNFGVQIFQGDGGLAVGLSIIVILALVAANYKLKSDKYKKTAEIFGKEIAKLNNVDLENKIFMSALSSKVEKNVYSILKN